MHDFILKMNESFVVSARILITWGIVELTELEYDKIVAEKDVFVLGYLFIYLKKI